MLCYVFLSLSDIAEISRNSKYIPSSHSNFIYSINKYNADDLQNWPTWLKWAVLIQVGYMAFLGPYNAALVNPSLVLLSDALEVSPKVAAYSTTTAIVMGGVSPFIYAPLANIYGRRPITLFAIVLTIIGGVTSASSTTFSQLIGTRALCGFGFGGMMSVGTACVNDMFFLHQRGEATGVYSLFVTNGAHVAAISKSARLNILYSKPTNTIQLVVISVHH